ncbi:hypothetical protein N7454_008646 [Penicillium verhagenii]|nr:hypothetical protein N7454_008646 [Penicillium verhagenii]
MAPNKVIIFGATGATGSAAALQAHKDGAEISLAVRDPTKPIPTLAGIPAQKVQADLTKPDTLTAAVRQTGATVAYLYVIFGTEDHMRASLVALKEAGITFVVLLSSFTVSEDPSAAPPSDAIPYQHGQVEISLAEVFGMKNFVAVRPAFFASNALWFKDGVAQGEVRHANPDAEFDYISPEDIGSVCGGILARGMSSENVVPLVGQERLTIAGAVDLIGEVLGKKVKTTRISGEEMKAGMIQHGVQELAARWVVNDVTMNPGAFFKEAGYQQALGNVKRYTGREPTRFRQWLEENKGRFEV